MDEQPPEPMELLPKVREGDAAACEALVRVLHPLVVKVVRSHLPRRTSEDDLVQIVFMRVFSKLDQFSGLVPLEHWVARIAVNTCLKQIGRERVRPELRMADLSEEEAQVVESLASKPDELSVSSSLASRELLEKLMERLDPKDRLVITLLHLEERSVDEIHQVTGWSRALVKVRAFRARHKLSKFLKELMQEESQ